MRHRQRAVFQELLAGHISTICKVLDERAMLHFKRRQFPRR